MKQREEANQIAHDKMRKQQIQKLNASINELKLVTERLQTLRRLRSERVLISGGSIDEQEFARMMQIVAEEHAAVQEAEKAHKVAEEAKLEAIQPSNPQELFDWYNQANRNLDKLVQVRREWDQYLVSQGGSRIPPHFIYPPAPTTAAWASFLVQAGDS